jgi:hypothetical protein
MASYWQFVFKVKTCHFYHELLKKFQTEKGSIDESKILGTGAFGF